MSELTPERVAFLKDKLQSWPGEMALTSEELADLLALLDDYEKVKAELSYAKEVAEGAGYRLQKAEAELSHVRSMNRGVLELLDKANAELARYAKYDGLIEAVGGPGEGEIEWGKFSTTKTAEAILSAALKAREAKELAHDDIHNCSNGAGETKSCGLCDSECEARDEVERRDKESK